MDAQSVIVLDTHVLVWWVDGERKKLSDRLIAATALVRNAPLVTHDDRLREVQSLQTIW
jgi:PIN domain nuclease of toxin-antitoxin system